MIESAEQILKKWYKPLHGISEIAQLQIEEAMKEYANKIVDEIISEYYQAEVFGETITIVEVDDIVKIKKKIN